MHQGDPTHEHAHKISHIFMTSWENIITKVVENSEYIVIPLYCC